MISALQRLALAKQHSHTVRLRLSAQAAFLLLMRLAVAVAETAMLLRAPQYSLARCIVIILLDLFLLAPLVLGLARNITQAQSGQFMHWFASVRGLFDAAATAALFWLEQLFHAALWGSLLRISEFFTRNYAPQWILSAQWCVTVLWIFSSIGLIIRRLTAFVAASDTDSCTVIRYLSMRRHLRISCQEIGSLVLSVLYLIFSSLFLPLLPHNFVLFLATLSLKKSSDSLKNSTVFEDLSQTQVFDSTVQQTAKNT